MQVQAAWRVRQSPWQDLLRPTPFEARLQRVRPILSGLLLAGVLALLGVLISSAGDALRWYLLPLLQSRPLALVIGLLFLLAILAAGMQVMRERWKK